MSGGTGISLISTLVTSPITLGANGYASTVTVTSTGTISSVPTMTAGYGYQVTMGSNDTTLINDGLISSGIAAEHINAGRGVTLASGYLLNAGTILGGNANYDFGGPGVVQTGGTLLNTGLIGGGVYYGGIGAGATAWGLDISGGYAKNEGRIVHGVNLNGGTVLNADYVEVGLIRSGQLINDGYAVVVDVLGGTLTNSGTLGDVRVGLPGYSLTGVVINTGTIDSANTGIGLSAVDGGTVFNSGFIGGGLSAGTGALDLILAPDSTIVGAISVDTLASNRLDLASWTSTGSLDIADGFSGFSTIAFDAGATWTLSGTAAELADGQRILGFGLGDTLVLDGVSDTMASFVAGTGLKLGSDTIDIAGSFTTTDFTVTTDGTNTTITAPCFCVGTRIRTPRGDAPAEDLAIGDEVCTAFHGVQRIKWIGRRGYEGRFIAGNRSALPVCLKASAIADGIPSRDLWVSPDHAICEGGVLIHAWRLVNGTSIVQAEMVERVEYRHIELEGHHIVFAEDCPTESFLDTNCRQRFANAQEYAALYGETEPGNFCLPLVQSGFHLENIRRRLAERAGVPPSLLPPGPLRGNLDEAGPQRLHGWAQDISAPETPVVLTVSADGKPLALVIANEFRADLRAAQLGSGCHAFSAPLPPGVGQVEIRRASDGAVLIQAPLTKAA